MHERLGLAGLALLLVSSIARGAEIRTISERLDEDVDSIAVSGGRAVLKTTKRSIPLEVVKQIRFDERAPMASLDATVILTNKDEVRGTIVPGDAKEGFTLRSPALGQVPVSLESVAAIFMQVPAEQERTLHAKHLGWLQAKGFAGRPNKDAVYIRAGGKAQGYIAKITESAVLLDMTEDNLGKQNFLLKDVMVVVLGNAGGTPPAPGEAKLRIRVRCTDGSTVSGEIAGLAGGKLTLETGKLALGTVTIEVKNVLDLFVLNGAFDYLSDMDPTNVVEKFPDGLDRDGDLWTWKRDKEVAEGGKLRLGGRQYDKGLGVHSYSELTFQLGGGYREFRAVIGLDDTTRFLGQPGMGSVRFRVLLDGKPCAEFPEGKLKRRGEAPDEISVNVEGKKTLTIVADYADFLHVLGRADWADAYLVKR